MRVAAFRRRGAGRPETAKPRYRKACGGANREANLPNRDGGRAASADSHMARYTLKVRIPRAPRFPFLLVLFAAISPLPAATVYQISWISARGSTTYNGSSLGAFTITNEHWAFQGADIPGNFSSTFLLPLGVLDPATAPASQTWTNGTGADAFFARLFLPLPDGPDTLAVQPLILDSTNLQPGDVSLQITNDGSAVRFNGGITAPAGLITISGVIGQGLPGEADTANASLALRRDSSLMVVEKLTGEAVVVPEPSTGWMAGMAGAILLARAFASRRAG